jgi:chlorite dismutase/heme-degrading monooxygenase HmoA
MVRREPPQTAEGWYALHDLRTIDWAAWRDAPERVRRRAIEEATALLQSAAAVEDADAGDSALFAVTGHKADLMVLHLRPTHAAVEHLERRFEGTEFARFTEQTSSYVSVTEASGYSERAREYIDGGVDDDSGLAQYIRSRLYPDIPDHEHVSFYPMSKRRDPDQNWYDLPFEERAEHMDSHGDIGREYAGKVQQMITGSVGMDDWEWGVTLWADDVTEVKNLLYEMRFDPSSSKFAEFGPFFLGRRLPPADLDAYLAGERVPTGEATETTETTAATGTAEPGEQHATTAGTDTPEPASENPSTDGADPAVANGGEESDGAGGRPPTPGDGAIETVGDVDRHLATFGVMPGDYDDAGYGLVCYADGDAESLVDEVAGLRENFDHYDTHVLTSVRADQGQAAVVSVWANERAASTAAGFLTDIDAVTRCVGGSLGEGADGAGEADRSGSAGTSAVAGATSDSGEDEAAEIREELANNEVYAGKPHGEDVYALVVYSTADPATLAENVDELRANFDRYDTHVRTAVYETDEGVRVGTSGESESEDQGTGGLAAVVTLWETEDAADTAAEYLTGLPEVVGRPEDRDGFGTMGMFYTVKPDYREEFVDTFGDVGAILDGMDGHRETALLVNRGNADDMFIASRWDSREDAMQFFRSEDFRETVEWGREVLADRPRHVFLA